MVYKTRLVDLIEQRNALLGKRKKYKKGSVNWKANELAIKGLSNQIHKLDERQ